MANTWSPGTKFSQLPLQLDLNREIASIECEVEPFFIRVPPIIIFAAQPRKGSVHILPRAGIQDVEFAKRTSRYKALHPVRETHPPLSLRACQGNHSGTRTLEMINFQGPPRMSQPWRAESSPILILYSQSVAIGTAAAEVCMPCAMSAERSSAEKVSKIAQLFKLFTRPIDNAPW